MRKLSLAILPLAWALTGCPTTDMIDHMEHQPKGKPYRASEVFPDGQLMRRPPADTVALEHDENNALGSIPDGGIAPATTNIPVPVDDELLTLGHAKFNQVCAVCHGVLADGNSVVARKMDLRPPPNITTDVYRNRSDANIFMTITNGFGYMNPYRDQLSSRERWAVVAYVRALQVSQNAGRDVLAAEDIQKLNAPPAPSGEGTETRHE
ncbi:MAG: cytochrome c [Deltaproteobacteria bacterium]|nr:cytochrome c [Deltaproteobacteria bacterium]